MCKLYILSNTSVIILESWPIW